MNKDVIYIDVEDDITAIIGKVKASSEKIVALVPPKRIGALQSAVNLRLLQRTAEHAGKRLVLITNNHALMALSAAASIPVAKNLQTKPEIAEIPALEIDDGDDIIDGAELPVGELEKTADSPSGQRGDVDKLVDDIATINKPTNSRTSPKASKKSGAKVPNFNTFRKKIFIGIAAGIVLVGGLVWAFVFAPAATVIISARTTSESINSVAQLSASSTDAKNGIIKASTKTVKKDASVEFEATGEEDRSTAATGTVTMKAASTSLLDNDSFIPANSVLTASSGAKFTTNNGVTLTWDNRGIATVGITAVEKGSSSNGASGATSSPVAGVTIAINGSTSGGVDKVVKVVTAADVQAASEKLVEQSSEAVKQELTAQFGSTYKVISDSFVTDRATPVSTPAIGAEASGKAKLTSQTTYSLTAIDTDTLKSYLDSILSLQLSSESSQRVYDTGIDKVALSGYKRDGDVSTARIVATGQIGPKIDEEAIKEQVKGKRYGDVQSSLESIDGVSDVDVKFSYFWVRTIPNNIDKITIEFKLQDA